MIETCRRLFPCVGVLTAVLAACDSTAPQVCTAEFVYGVQITVRDSVTSQILTDSISGTLVDGTFSEAMIVLGNVLAGAGEREGTYSATVQVPGYAPWSRSGIVVTADECHVRPVELEALVQSL